MVSTLGIFVAVTYLYFRSWIVVLHCPNH